jgi:hypothetical protein
MKLEQQVTSLELSKRLKELGVKQASLFWYWGTKEEFETGKGFAGPLMEKHRSLENLSAYTVAELGEMLPKNFPSYRCDWGMSSEPLKNYMCWRADGLDTREYFGTTEAEARGRMLEYLIKNGLLTSE